MPLKVQCHCTQTIGLHSQANTAAASITYHDQTLSRLLPANSSTKQAHNPNTLTQKCIPAALTIPHTDNRS